MKIIKLFIKWLSKVDEFDREAKRMRREDRLGEVERSSLCKDSIKDHEEKESRKMKA